MSLHEMLVLGVIMSAFVSFSVVLAATCWYCRGAGIRHIGRSTSYPSAAGLITDDD